MSGGGGKCAALPHFLEDRLGKRRPLYRIGSGAKLIKKHKRAIGHTLHDVYDIDHMCREGGKRLLDALLVPNIHKDLGEDPHLGLFLSRELKPCLCHKGKKTQCLQRDGLTARIRPRDHQRIKIAAKRDIDRNDPILIDQRVTAPKDRDTLLLRQNGRMRTESLGISRTGKGKGDLGHIIAIGRDRSRMIGASLRKFL